MHVKNRTLLATAALVWGLAGINILRLGLQAYPPVLDVVHLIGSLIVFLLFKERIFTPLVREHSRRIATLVKPHLYQFFDRKSFIIMALMMSMGIGLRSFGLVPNGFIAFFYTGLGAALCLAGILFAINYIRVLRSGDFSVIIRSRYRF